MGYQGLLSWSFIIFEVFLIINIQPTAEGSSSWSSSSSTSTSSSSSSSSNDQSVCFDYNTNTGVYRLDGVGSRCTVLATQKSVAGNGTLLKMLPSSVITDYSYFLFV